MRFSGHFSGQLKSVLRGVELYGESLSNRASGAARLGCLFRNGNITQGNIQIKRRALPVLKTFVKILALLGHGLRADRTQLPPPTAAILRTVPALSVTTRNS
jgi:hypothetical protein